MMLYNLKYTCTEVDVDIMKLKVIIQILSCTR